MWGKSQYSAASSTWYSADAHMAEPHTTRRAPSLLLAVGGCAFVGTLIAYYAFSYIPSRERYFVESRLRELAVLAGQIEGAIATQIQSAHGSISDLATNYPNQLHDPNDELVTAKLERAGVVWGRCREAARDGPTPKTAAYTNPAMPDGPTLTVEFIPGSAGVSEETNPFVGRSDTASGWATTSRDSTLYFAAADAGGTTLICPTKSLSELIEPLLQANGRDVQDVLVAQDDQVFFQRGRRDLRITAAKVLAPAPAVADGRDGSKQPPREIGTSSKSLDIELGGQTFKLFVQPVHIEGIPRVFVATFQPKRDFDESIRAVSFGALAHVPLLLILALLAVPAIKVATISGYDRLKASDVAGLAVCMVIMAAVATALTTSLVASASLDDQLDEDLRTVAKKMRRNIQTEITQITLALEQFIADRRCPEKTCDPPPRIVQMLGDNARAEGIDTAGLTMTRSGGANDPRTAIKRVTAHYPFVALLTWASPDGWQREKWTSGAVTTTLIKVSGTPSFDDAMHGRLWGWPRNGAHRAAAFAFHVRRSRNTSALLPTVSMPIRDDTGATAGVATMVPELVSLWRPVLPPGFTFAVIQGDGRVVFHTAMAPKIHENFFDECDVGGAIRSIIEGSGDGFLSGTYHARAKRFFVSPIAHSPWTLIVMRDQEAQRSQQLDVLAAWVVLFSLYALLLLAVLAVCIQLLGHDWYWPSQERAPVYAAASLMLAAISVVSAAIMVWHPGGSSTIGAVLVLVFAGLLCTIGLCAAVPRATIEPELLSPTRSTMGWIAVGSAALVLWVCTHDAITGLLFAVVVLGALANVVALFWSGEARAGRRWRRDFLFTEVLLLVVVAIVPSLVFLQDAWVLGVEAFVRHGQLKLAEQIDTLRRENADQYRSIGIEDPTGSLLMKRQDGLLTGPNGENAEIVTATMFGTPDPKFENSVCPDPDATPPRTNGGSRSPEADTETYCGSEPSPFLLRRVFSRFLSDRSSGAVMAELPVYHEESLQLRELFASRAADCRWVWRRNGEQAELCWKARDTGTPASTARNPYRATKLVSHGLPDVPKTGLAGTLWLTVLAALSLTGVLYLLRWLSARVLGLGNIVATPPEPSADVQHARGVFALGGRGSRGDVPLRTVLFDLHAGSPDLHRLRALDPAPQAVIIDHLEEALRSPERAAFALTLLEQLLADRPIPLVVLSEVDPLIDIGGVAKGNGADAEAAAAAQSARTRWARCLEQLCSLPPPAAAAELGPLTVWAMAVGDKNALKSLGTCGEWSDRARRVIDEECQWTPRLRGIAKEIPAFDRPFFDPPSQVRAASRAHYRSLWDRRSEVEQLTLAELGRERFVNPQRWRVAGALARAGLIHFALGPRVMNESFRRFASSQERTLTQGARAAEGSLWNRTRGVLTYAFIGGGLLIYFSQPEGWAQLVGAVGALASFATRASEVLGLFRRGGGATG